MRLASPDRSVGAEVRAEGDGLEDALLVLGVDVGRHVAGDEAGGHGVGHDGAAGVLAGDRLRQANDARLSS